MRRTFIRVRYVRSPSRAVSIPRNRKGRYCSILLGEVGKDVLSDRLHSEEMVWAAAFKAWSREVERPRRGYNGQGGTALRLAPGEHQHRHCRLDALRRATPSGGQSVKSPVTTTFSARGALTENGTRRVAG